MLPKTRASFTTFFWIVSIAQSLMLTNLGPCNKYYSLNTLWEKHTGNWGKHRDIKDIFLPLKLFGGERRIFTENSGRGITWSMWKCYWYGWQSKIIFSQAISSWEIELGKILWRKSKLEFEDKYDFNRGKWQESLFWVKRTVSIKV